MRPFLPLALILAAAGCQKPASQPDANQAADPSSWTGPQATAPVAGEGSLPAGKLDRGHAGSPAPDLSVEDPAGQPAKLGDFRGKPLLVNLWATWCGPCITEMPTLDALARREGGKIQILAISQDMGDNARAKVDAFFTDRAFHQLKPYLDSKMALMSALKVDTLPTTILYDSDGKEVWRIVGIEDWESDDAAKLLAEAK
jgi:thiol-disulfide isomerase/thioredoxin